MSGCIFKDTLSNDTQVFLKFKISIFEVYLHLSFSFTPYFVNSSTLGRNTGTSKKSHLIKSEIALPALPITFWSQYLIFSCILSILKFENVLTNFSRIQWSRIFMWNNRSMTRVHPDQTRQLSSTPKRCQATISGKWSISSIAFPGPQVVTIDSVSNEPTMPCGFVRPLPNLPPSLNDLNPPTNPFNIVANMAVENSTEGGHDENYSPHSPEPSEPSPISMHPMNLSAIEGWQTPHRTTDDNTFYSDDKTRRI